MLWILICCNLTSLSLCSFYYNRCTFQLIWMMGLFLSWCLWDFKVSSVWIILLLVKTHIRQLDLQLISRCTIKSLHLDRKAENYLNIWKRTNSATDTSVDSSQHKFLRHTHSVPANMRSHSHWLDGINKAKLKKDPWEKYDIVGRYPKYNFVYKRWE